MSTIQNLKNFIRHGKQARDAKSPPDQAQVSNVHAQQQRHNHNYAGAQQQQAQHNQYAMSDPNVYAHQPLQANAPQGDFSAAAVDQRNVAARAGQAAGQAVEDKQKRKDAEEKKKNVDPDVLQRIVAEERESKGKLPRYPGLDRWTLVEKMGDGAFSNVYRAKDNQGQYPEVAIKVVRKFEMNSQQVRSSMSSPLCIPFSSSCTCVPCIFLDITNLLDRNGHWPTMRTDRTFFTRTSRGKRQKQWRCARTLFLFQSFS